MNFLYGFPVLCLPIHSEQLLEDLPVKKHDNAKVDIEIPAAFINFPWPSAPILELGVQGMFCWDVDFDEARRQYTFPMTVH